MFGYRNTDLITADELEKKASDLLDQAKILRQNDAEVNTKKKAKIFCEKNSDNCISCRYSDCWGDICDLATRYQEDKAPIYWDIQND